MSSALPALAEDFYEGKTLTLLIGSNAGGGIDLLARPFAPVWSKHIPGNPDVIVKNVPGGGGLKMLNQLYSPQIRDDGYTIAFTPWRPMSRILEDPAVRHNIHDGHLIAAAGNIPMTMVATKVLPEGNQTSAGVFEIADPIVVAGSRRDDAVSLLNRISLNLSGVQYRYVFGYRGQNNIMTSLVQDESQSFPTLGPAYKQLVEANVTEQGIGIPAWIHTRFDANGEPVEDYAPIEGIPQFHQVYRDVHGELPSGSEWEAYKWLSNLQYNLPVGVWAPPGTPEEAVAILRESHAKTVADPDHIPPNLPAINLDLVWADHEEAAKRLEIFRSITPEVLATVKGFIEEEAEQAN